MKKISRKTKGNNFNFDSKEHIAIEIPTGGQNVTQVIEMKHIGQGVFIYQSLYVNKKVSRFSVHKGEDAKKAIIMAVKATKIECNCDNKVISMGSKAILMKKSSVFGIMAIEGDFQQGSKNSEYSLFQEVERLGVLRLRVLLSAKKRSLEKALAREKALIHQGQRNWPLMQPGHSP